MIQKKEASEILGRMSADAKINMVIEYHALRQGLCANTLSIPTGANDWVSRSIDRAMHLRNCETQLRILYHEVSAAFEKAKWETKITECFNCRGEGTVNGETCCICMGAKNCQF